MNILITGGAGFIGSHIVDAYIADGHEVIVIDNLSTGRRENLNPKAKFYEIDICDAAVAEIFAKERPEVLNHHAAQIDVRKSVADPLFDLNVNVGGLVNLLEAGRRNGLKKCVLASSGGTVYGDQEKFPAAEDHHTRPISPYGLNKLACEQYLFYTEREYGIEWTALRYANIYGPRQNPHGEAGVVAIFIEKMLAGLSATRAAGEAGGPVINGDGKQTRDYVYVGDVVEANRLALSTQKNPLPPCGRELESKNDPLSPCGRGLGRGGAVYNIGTGVETDVNAIFRALREITGAKCKEEHGPAKPGEQLRSVVSAAKIERELGWRPRISFAEGMKKTVEWFK